VSCYRHLTKSESEIDAAEVARRSESGDQKAVIATRTHYEYLIRAAATLSNALQAKGVFLAGGNQVKNSKFVSECRDYLHSSFLNCTKHEWLTPVTVSQQIADINLNLLGCVAAAQTQRDEAHESK